MRAFIEIHFNQIYCTFLQSRVKQNMALEKGMPNSQVSEVTALTTLMGTGWTGDQQDIHRDQGLEMNTCGSSGSDISQLPEHGEVS